MKNIILATLLVVPIFCAASSDIPVENGFDKLHEVMSNGEYPDNFENLMQRKISCNLISLEIERNLDLAAEALTATTKQDLLVDSAIKYIHEEAKALAYSFQLLQKRYECEKF